MLPVSKWNHRIRLEFGLVLVLSVLIILFWEFPRIGSIATKLPPVPNQHIRMIRIPRTIQKMRHQAPPPVRPSIPVPGDEIEMLEEMPLTSTSQITAKGQFSADVPLNENELPYVPRQIVEVLPRVSDLNVHGEVTLKLLIDTHGRVKKYQVLSNSTANPVCLQRVIEAALKSRWEVVRLNENKVEYWLVKQYRFGEAK